jgi:hypothetical protein
MNDDGNLDIITFNLGGPRVKDLGVVLWKRVVQGFPEFDTPQKFTIGEKPSDLVTADFNNDGNDDVAMLNRPAGGTGNSDVNVLLSQGNGILLPPTIFPVACPFFTGGAPCRARTMAAGDFDGNGQIDLVVTVADPRRSRGAASGNADAMQAFGGRGDGGFVPGPVFATQKTPDSMAAGDFTGDGKIDVAVANQRTLDLQVFVNVSSPGGTANGEMCQTGDECLSSRCTNGVCCGAQCDLNEVCNVPGKEGICIPLSTVPEPCTDPSDCEADGAFCVVGQCCDDACIGGRCSLSPYFGTCIPGIPDGEECSGDDAECASSHCSDNFRCCREACDGGYCDQFGICKPLTDLGDMCVEDVQCQSEVCDAFDLICCNRRCNEATEVCNPDGRCGAPIRPGTSTPTPNLTGTAANTTPTVTATPRLTPGGNGEECALGGDCTSGFCVNAVCCVERICGGDAHCAAGTGTCESGGTPTRTPTSTRLPVTPTVNPCSPNPCPSGQKCIANAGQAQCIVTSSSGGCATSGDAGSDSNLLVAAMLPLALWFGRRLQLKRAVAKR